MYTYNRLQSAIDNGGRYVLPADLSHVAGFHRYQQVKLAVANEVVYGTPSPTVNSVPVVNGIGTGNVSVVFSPAVGVPASVTVSVNSLPSMRSLVRIHSPGNRVVTFPLRRSLCATRIRTVAESKDPIPDPMRRGQMLPAIQAKGTTRPGVCRAGSHSACLYCHVDRRYGFRTAPVHRTS